MKRIRKGQEKGMKRVWKGYEKEVGGHLGWSPSLLGRKAMQFGWGQAIPII